MNKKLLAIGLVIMSILLYILIITTYLYNKEELLQNYYTMRALLAGIIGAGDIVAIAIIFSK